MEIYQLLCLDDNKNCKPPFSTVPLERTRALSVQLRMETDLNSDVSRASTLSAHIYLRQSPTTRGSSSSNDIYLGGIKVNPIFDETVPPPGFTLIDQSIVNEWVPLTGGAGALRIRVSYKPNQNQALTIDAFDLLKVVGKGSFGKVMQVRKRDTSRIYALKTIRKAHIVSRSEVTHTDRKSVV